MKTFEGNSGFQALRNTSAPSSELADLRRTVRDLVALSALPSIWVDCDLRRSVQNLTDVLRAALRAWTVCARLEMPDGTQIDAGASEGLSSGGPRSYDPSELLDCAASESREAIAVERLNGYGPFVALTQPIYFEGRRAGYLLACYRQNYQCSERARLLLQVAANQAGFLLQRHKHQEERSFRIEAENRLRQTEHHYQQLVQSLPAAIYTCDAEGKITLYNEAAVKLWGRRPVLGEDRWCGSWKIFGADGKPMRLEDCPMSVAVREGKSVRGQEIVVERPDGTRAWILPHPDPIRDEKGQVVGTVNMLIDVQPLKAAEQAARASEARLRSLLSLMPAAVYACDSEGRITFYNRRAAELWGREPDLNDDHQRFCAAYKCWFGGKVLAPEDTPMAVAVREGKTFRDLEPVFERPDGRKISVLVNIDPLFDEHGKPAGAINVFQDVTPLKRAQAELRARHEHLQAIIDNTPECVKIVAEDGTLLAMNEVGLGLIEAESLDQALGKNIYEVIAPEYKEAFQAMNERVCRGAKERLEFQIIGLKGRRRWMETHAGPVNDPISGKQVHLAITRDVTEKKRAEEALRQRTRSLEIINRVGSTLAAELDLEALVQAVTDAGREVTGAEFGAFFYNTKNESGEAYTLYTLSGAPREAFSKFPMPRNTAIFDPTFKGRGVIRLDDVTQDSRYGKNPPYHGMPKGHLPVRSYLAVPVVSRHGETLGGLFYGHPQAGVFTEESEKIMVAIAAQAAVAIDNAQLYRAAQKEIAERKRTEENLKNRGERLQLLSDTLGQLLSARDPEMIVRELFPKVASHLGADTYFNFVVDQPGLTLKLHSCAGIPEERMAGLGRIAFGEAICGAVAETRAPIHAQEIQTSSDPRAALARSLGLQCYACNPLLVGDSLLGTLSFASRTRPAFNEDELQFIRIISQYAAVALERLQSAERLRESEERFRAVLDNSATVIYVKDAEGRYLLINGCYERLFHISEADILGKTDFDVFPRPLAEKFRENDLRVLNDGESVEMEELAPHDDGLHTYISIKFPLRKADGRIYAVAGISTDISARKRDESLLRGQKEALQLIAQDAPLVDVMEKLIEAIERHLPGLTGTVLLLDKDGVHLRPFAGKRCPEEWVKLITPLRIGPSVGSCGTAAYRNEPVIVENTQTDPLWVDFKDSALQYGFRACWSIPIRSSGGKVLGTFAGYYNEPRRPSEGEWKVVELLSQTAALAIERQQAREARQKLSALIEHSPNFVGVADLEQRVLFVNAAGQDLVGVAGEQIVQTTILDYFAECERERVRREIMPILREKKHWDGEVMFRHFQTGQMIPMMWNAFVIPDPLTHEPAFYACVSTDITERRKVEDALRRSERLFRELADSMPQIVWAAGPDGTVDYFNKRWYEFTGFPENDTSTASWESVLHPDDVERCRTLYSDCIREERPYQIEYRFKDRHLGGYRWFLGRALPVRDDSGKVIRWFGACTDIDDQKRAEEKLEKTVAERTASLREAIGQMEEFSYTVSHDLRAPLRGMQVYTEALLEDFSRSVPPEAGLYLQRISVNAKRLDKMILDVLTFSRLARTELRLERVELDRLVRQIVEQYPGLQPPQASIRIEPLPDVLGHEPSLTQAISNLLSNAVKFVHPGATPTIRIRPEKRGKTIRVWIEDNGIGIDPKHQHRLFNMFERVHPDLKYDGTGVGLAIVRKAMERMGGKTGVESDGRNGSRFWIETAAIENLQ